MTVPAPGERVASMLTVTSLHAEPTRRSEQVTDALLGESLDVHEVGGSERDPWLRVSGGDAYEGWLPASHVAVLDAAWTGGAPRIVRAVRADVTAADGTRLRPVVHGCRLLAGTATEATVDVTLPGGATGRVEAAAFLPFHDPVGPVDAIVRAHADAFLGVPYRWGGRSPWGFDCSGLVQVVMRALGLELPRDSYQMEDLLVQTGVRVEAEASRAGDVVFWGRDDRATHVAVVLGGGRFLHARDWVRVGEFAGGLDGDLAPLLRGVYRPAFPGGQ